MYVCICKAITDRQLRQEVASGADSLRKLSRGTGLGTCCGKCVRFAAEEIARCCQLGGTDATCCSAQAQENCPEAGRHALKVGRNKPHRAA